MVNHQLHLADALGDDYFKQVEMDLKLQILEQEEAEIKDVDWVREQKKKLLFQQQLQEKMRLLRMARQKQGGFSQAATNQLKDAMSLSLIDHIQNSHSFTKKISIEDIDSNRRAQALRTKKLGYDREDEGIARMGNNSKIAMLARYNELHDRDRIDTVKLPKIYQAKSVAERDDESFGLLKNFQ